MKVTSWAVIKHKLFLEAYDFLKEAYGIELNIPIIINGRLKSTYGRFIYRETRK
jgi:SprT-like protein